MAIVPLDQLPEDSKDTSTGSSTVIPINQLPDNTDKNTSEVQPQDISVKGLDLNEGPAAMLRAPFMGKSMQEGFDNPKSIPKFESVYSDAVQKMVGSVPGVSNLPTDAQIALMHTASYPAAVAGYLVDTTMNPIESIAALVIPGASKGLTSAEEFMAPMAEKILSKLKKPTEGINFGGNKELTTIAKGAADSLQAAKDAFSAGYNTLFEKVGQKTVPDAVKNGLTQLTTSALEQTSPGSFADKYLQIKFPEILKDATLTVEKLHAIKGDIFKHAKASLGVDRNALMQVYNGINKALSGDSLAGTDYARLTGQFEGFMKNESAYVKDLILDKFKNVTSKKLAPSGMLGIKTPINLADNYRVAFEKLSGRKTSPMNVLKELDALRKGTMIKRAVLAGAATLLSPELKKVASFVAHSV